MIDYTAAESRCLSLSDVQQMQSQKEMHQKVQHSEVPSDPRASYPFLKSFLFQDSSMQMHLDAC